jgi:hypothetical protein
MLNDFKPINTSMSILVKYADDLTSSSQVRGNNDCSLQEVESIKKWARDNLMTKILLRELSLFNGGKENDPPLPYKKARPSLRYHVKYHDHRICL